MGRYNGFGGKVESNETIEQGAKREVLEEAGIKVQKLEKVGIHEFEFAHDKGNILEVHVFQVLEYSGEPIETEGKDRKQLTEDVKNWIENEIQKMPPARNDGVRTYLNRTSEEN